MNAIAFTGSLIVLVGYFVSVRLGAPDVFHRANIVGGVLLVATGIALGAIAHAFLSFAFMVIAAYGLVSDR